MSVSFESLNSLYCSVYSCCKTTIQKVDQAKWAKTGKKVAAIALPLFQVAVVFTISFALISSGAVTYSMLLLQGALMVALITTVAKTAYNVLNPQPMATTHEQFVANIAAINMVNCAGFGTLLHECGHSLMAWACYKNASPSVNILFFTGGATSYTPSYGLTRFGGILGFSLANLAITAAGIGASTCFALADFAAAYYSRKSHPKLASLLTAHGVSLLLNEILYGMSSFGMSLAGSPGHDFLLMWHTWAIHPAILIGALIALPLVELALFILSKKLAEKICIEHKKLAI